MASEQIRYLATDEDGRDWLNRAGASRYRAVTELSNELRTRMIGNAVSTPVATMLGHAVMEALR